MTRKVKYLGIDFGSSNTVVTALIEGVRDPVVFTYTAARAAFPTAVCRKTTAPEIRLYDGEKRKPDEAIESTIKENFSRSNNRRYVDYVKQYFELIKSRITVAERAPDGTPLVVYDFSEVEKIYFGHPAYFKNDDVEAYRSNMTAILSEVFGVDKRKIHGAPEPELAAHAYHKVGSGKRGYAVKDRETVLVLDFGGYTLDVVLMKNDGGMKQVRGCGSVEADNICLGKEITLRLCEALYGEDAPFDYGIDEAKCELFANGSYRTEVIERPYMYANERYRIKYEDNSSAPHSACFVGHSSGSIGVDGIFSRLATYIQAFLQGSGIGAEQINHVLFTGGTARMSPLREVVMDRVCGNASELMIDSEQTKAFGEIFLEWKNPEKRKYPLSSELAVSYGALLAAQGAVKFSTASAAAPRRSNGNESSTRLAEYRHELNYYRNRYDEMKKLLTPEQYAKLVNEFGELK